MQRANLHPVQITYRPAPPVAVARPRGPVAGPGLRHICGVPHRPLTLWDLQPGDVGFTYKRSHKKWQQRVICAAERWQRLRGRSCLGSPHVTHAFVMMQAFPRRGQLQVADAVAGTKQTIGVGLMTMRFSAVAAPPEPPAPMPPYEDRHARYLVYRFADARLRRLVVRLAQNWSVPQGQNFSLRRALQTPFVARHLTPQAQARLQRLSCQLQAPIRGVPQQRNGQPYRVMCAEFVASLAKVAADSLPQAAGTAPYPTPPCAAGLEGCEPRSLTPADLQGMLCHSPAVQVVGYVPTCAEMCSHRETP